MARMTAPEAAVYVMEKGGVQVAFGVPGAAINPLYAALRKRDSIRHILARHVEGASHMAEGYTRAKAGKLGVCIGTSGPAGTDMRLPGCIRPRPIRYLSFASPARRARDLMKLHSVPVVVEIILERVTNIAMGTDIDAINEFNDVLDVK